VGLKEGLIVNWRKRGQIIKTNKKKKRKLLRKQQTDIKYQYIY